MGELHAGERLLLAGGQAATATSVRTEHLASPVTVYNFEVADWHTYHVGTVEAGWVYVHNSCTPKYNTGSKRFHDPKTGRFVKTPVKNKVLRPDAEATLYAKVDGQGQLRKWGVTHHENPRLRYTAEQIGDGDVIRLRRGPREQMMRKERRLTERHPGPDNHEDWAGWRTPNHPNYRGRR